MYVSCRQLSLPKTIEFFLHSFEHGLFSMGLMFDRSKLESPRDVSVTRISDTLSYGFPQTELHNFAE